MRTWLFIVIAVAQMLTGVAPGFAMATTGEESVDHCDSVVSEQTSAHSHAQPDGHLPAHAAEGDCSTECQLCASCGLSLHSAALHRPLDQRSFDRPSRAHAFYPQPVKLLFRPPI